jgi:hypothetical protein
MVQPSQIRFLTLELHASFERLRNGDQQERELYIAIGRALKRLEDDAFCGTQIAKRLIPAHYGDNDDIKNLWKYDLPKGWLLLYTITTEEVVVFAIILEWLSHKRYERRFKY